MRPNVLLVVLDAVRADHTSVHGYDRPTTPHLEELAADGFRFENAFTAAPWTPPSHGSIFSGVHPGSHGYLDSGMSYAPPHPPIAERLGQEGYRTFGAVQNAKIGSRTEVSRGFKNTLDLYRLPFSPTSVENLKKYYLDLLPGYVRMVRRMRGTDRKPTEFLSAEYVRTRIRRAEDDEPFFGFINVLSAHSRYAPPEPYRDRFAWVDRSRADDRIVDELASRGGYRFIANEIEPEDSEWASVEDLYDGEIAFADHILGTILETLRETGTYDETMVVVTADHGEHFGEHGRAYHQFSLFDELLHVPLVVKPPRSLETGTSVQDLVSLVDVYPTVLSTLGLEIPRTAEGVDLFGAGTREAVFAEYGEPKTAVSTLENRTLDPVDEETIAELDHALQCVRTRDRKYVRVHGGEDEVYDVGQGDPKDTRRQTGNHDDLAAEIAEVLGSDLRVETTEPDSLDVQENLRALGYR